MQQVVTRRIIFRFSTLVLSLLSFGNIVAQNVLMGRQARVVTCGGTFYDSGGRDGNYANNENFTITICSDQSAGSHVQLVFIPPRIFPGDRLCFFDGENASAPRLSCASDFHRGSPFIIQATAANTSGCLTITFVSDASSNDEGWEARINCVPACQTIQSRLVTTEPVVAPADTGWIDACRDQPITFKAQGVYPQNGLIYQHSDLSSEFEWTFGDGFSAVGPEVTHAYRRSGGYVVQLTITDQFGCRSTNFINQRVRISTFPQFTIAGDLPPEVCAGDTVALSAAVNRRDPSKVVSVEPAMGSFQAGGGRADSLALPDGTGAAYETSIEFSNFLPGQTLSSVDDLRSICVNMEHSWMRDLEISLRCPNGSSVILHNHAGQVGGRVYLGEPVIYDDFNIRPGVGYDYCWTRDANRPTWLEYANTVRPPTLPPGDYRPYESLEELMGCPLNGEWTIRVVDLWAQDNGFIFYWGLDFNPELFPNLETFTPNLVDYSWEPAPVTLLRTPDSLIASPQNAGRASYVFSVTDDFGCTYDTAVSVLVLPPTHPNCYECAENVTLPPNRALCPDEELQVDISVPAPEPTEITFEAFPRYVFNAGNHPPARPYISTIQVSNLHPDDMPRPNERIVSVCLDLETDWAEDIAIFLRAPSGAQMALSVGNGGNGKNYTNTCFTPNAATSIRDAQAPFSGEFQPQTSWELLRASPIEGQWALIVSDAAGAEDFNRLLRWSITFTTVNEISYAWQPPAGLSCADCPNPTIKPASTTDYVVEVRDAYGCLRSDTLTVGVVKDLPVPELNCTVSDDGEITFFWTPLDNSHIYETRLRRNGDPLPWQRQGELSVIVHRNLRPGDELSLELRHYIGADPVSCEIQVASTACVFRPCTFDIGLAEAPRPLSCHGALDGAVSIRAEGGDPPYLFALDGGAPQDSGLFSGLSGGPHFVVVSDTGYCLDTVFFNIPEPAPLLVVPLQLEQSCPGAKRNQAQANISGGTPPYRSTWSDGQTTNTAVGLDSLLYRVSVIDANGCAADGEIKLQDLPEFDPNVIQSTPACFGFADGKMGINFIEFGPSADPADYTYRWSTGETTPTIENLLGGREYTVTVTSFQGCEVVVTRTLRQPSEITFELAVEDILCHGQSQGAAAVRDIRGDRAEFFIAWDARAGGQSSPRVEGLAPGFYSVTVSDRGGCSSTKSFQITETPPIIVEVTTRNNPCFGDQKGGANADIRGGKPPYSLAWSNGAITSQVTGLAADNYQLTVSDANECRQVVEVVVGQPSLLSGAAEVKNPTCHGYRDGALTIAMQGGTPPYLFSLDNEAFSGANMLVGLKEGVYNIYVKDANGCLFLDRATLTAPPPFEVSAGSDVNIILGDTLLLRASARNAQGEVEFVWTAPYDGTLSCTECAQTMVRTINTITYELYGIDERGCEAKDFITVHVDKPRAVSVPTGFTPNGDGRNDRLLVHGRHGTRVLLFQIYNRWGELVYSARDFPVNDEEAGWDGDFLGQQASSDVYVWYLEVEYIDGARDTFRGHTTLIR
jgi:gliding motility-associated-like protein